MWLTNMLKMIKLLITSEMPIKITMAYHIPLGWLQWKEQTVTHIDDGETGSLYTALGFSNSPDDWEKGVAVLHNINMTQQFLS